MTTIWIYTGGYLHDLPDFVTADVAEDLRDLRDPAHVPSGEMLDMRGDVDPEVRAFVLATKGAPERLGAIVQRVVAKAQGQDEVVLTLGCAGGKHRAASFGVFIAKLLRDLGFTVELTHLHAHLPRVIKNS